MIIIKIKNTDYETDSITIIGVSLLDDYSIRLKITRVFETCNHSFVHYIQKE